MKVVVEIVVMGSEAKVAVTVNVTADERVLCIYIIGEEA